MPVITVSREFGSGGHELGRRLAEALGFAFYDREILSVLARDTALDEGALERMLEQRPDAKPVPCLAGRTPLSATGGDALPARLTSRQRSIILDLAGQGSCVIVGSHADVYLRAYAPLRLFVYAAPEARLARCRARDTEGADLSGPEEVWQRMLETDRRRAAGHELIAPYPWGDRRGYDLCVRTDGMNIRTIVPALAVYARAWFG